MALEGGCYCGALRYEATGDPLFKGQKNPFYCVRLCCSALGKSLSYGPAVPLCSSA